MTRITRTRMAVLCALALAVLLMAAPAFAAAPNPTVFGTLYGSDGAVIAGGQVVVNHQVKGVWKPLLTLVTTSGGTWTFTAKADSYQLDFSAGSADSTTRLLTTARGGTYPVDVTLQAYGDLAGTITEAGTGAPIAGANVEVFLRNNDGTWPSTPAATTSADGSGAYAFTALPCGVYAVKAGGSACVTAFLGGATIDAASPLVVTRGGSSSATFALQSLGEIHGVIADADSGLALGGATVELYRQNPDGTWSLQTTLATAGDGSYASDEVLTGTWAIKACAAGYCDGFCGGGTTPDTAGWVALTRGASYSADIGLEPTPPVGGTGTISGVVVRYASRTPMAGAYVYIYRQNDDGTWPPTSPGWGSPTLTVFTDATGHYTSGPLPLGNYKIRFFDIHTGAQWWQYVPTVDTATVISITYDGQLCENIEAWFNRP